MDAINVLTAADNNYARHLGVMLHSLLSSASRQARFHICVLDGGISKSNSVKLRLVAANYNAAINFVGMDTSAYATYPISNHIKHSAYYRITIPDHFDASAEKAIYLDCDIIVKEDISNLWKTDISGYFLAAVEDPACPRQEALSMPSDSLYFNSGVMLVNLVKWREAGITSRLHSYIRDNADKLLLHDQDALNAVLYGGWLRLPPKWNQQTDMFRLSHSEASFHFEEYAAALQTPALIHYTTSSKPWHCLNEHPFRDEYFAHLQQTGWRTRFPAAHRIIDSFTKVIKKRLIKALHLGT